MSQSIRELIAEQNDQMLFADGFDEALIGVAHKATAEPVAAYDYDACLDVLMKRDGMSEEEAREFFEFNTLGAYVGENTPIFVQKFSTP